MMAMCEQLQELFHVMRLGRQTTPSDHDCLFGAASKPLRDHEGGAEKCLHLAGRTML